MIFRKNLAAFALALVTVQRVTREPPLHVQVVILALDLAEHVFQAFSNHVAVVVDHRHADALLCAAGCPTVITDRVTQIQIIIKVLFPGSFIRKFLN